MKRGDFLQKWGLCSLKSDLGFVKRQFFPVAWELYIKLATLQPELHPSLSPHNIHS